MKYTKKIIAFVLTFIMTINVFTGCSSGKNREVMTGYERTDKNIVADLKETENLKEYKAEFTELGDSDSIRMYSTALKGGEPFYVSMDPSGDGGIYVYRYGSGEEAETGTELISGEKWIYPGLFDISNDGEYYLLWDQVLDNARKVTLYRFDAGGNIKSSFDFPEDINIWSFTAGEADRIYTIEGDGAKNTIRQYDLNGNQLENLAGLPQTYYNVIGSGGEGRLILGDIDKMYEYVPAKGECREILNWLDVGIEGNKVRKLERVGEEYIVLIDDFDRGKCEIAKITEKNGEETGDGPVDIVIDTFSIATSLQSAISSYNRSQSDYRIVTRVFHEGENIATEEDRDKMMLDLLGENPPDMIDLGLSTNIGDFITKGYVENLNSYVENSSEIDLNNYFENVLDGFREGEFLAAIPPAFGISSYLTGDSEFPDSGDWTVRSLIEYDLSNPDKNLPENFGEWDVLNLCLYRNLEHFVNIDTGSCSFDNEDFRMIMEYAREYAGKGGIVSNTDIPTATTILKWCANDRLEDMQYCGLKTFGEDYRYIGYPTFDGKGGHEIYYLNGAALAITSWSGHKEGAWDFIEYYLGSIQIDTAYTGTPYGIPSDKRLVEEQIELLRSEDGPLKKMEIYISSEGGESQELLRHPLTEEEVSAYREIIESAVARPLWERSVNSIIAEESGAYFAGQKSLDEVIKTIESRVGIYLAEKYGSR